MPKLKPGTLIPTPEEDATATAAAQADPDAQPMTDAEWAAVKPGVRRGRRPPVVTKERITIRLSRGVVETFRASGTGWQSRIDAALKEWQKTHTPG
ncbi:MAG: BrnA antitoxin family protein [Zoogloea sp.]|uniref:BrnA antitoxin family protein n=1 Tax=Zoogloea sp. TaxID=49181 RepID=UPI002629FF7B|nr:BrnA antitoxin family protein [Zoogloea sp.]MDD2990796.1 BrnA antitoxin family protein [Zoogloea sp.]